MESEVHQMIWFHSGKSSIYFWNQFRILVYFNLHRSPPSKLKSPPNLVNHKIGPITHKISPPWTQGIFHIDNLNAADVRRLGSIRLKGYRFRL